MTGAKTEVSAARPAARMKHGILANAVGVPKAAAGRAFTAVRAASKMSADKRTGDPDLKIAIPTSVLIMAFTSVLGILVKNLTTGLQPDVYEYWLAAEAPSSVTGQFLSGERAIPVPERRTPPDGRFQGGNLLRCVCWP